MATSDLVVFIDMDGVVADFSNGVDRLHGHRMDYESLNQHRGTERWDLPKFFDGSKSEFWNPMGYDFWRGLNKTSEADQIVASAIGIVGIDYVCFLTVPCKTVGCFEGKVDWAIRYYPGLPVIAAPSEKSFGGSRKELIARPNAFLVDDNDDNIAKWIDRGGPGFLYPRPWNKDYRYEYCGFQNYRQCLWLTHQELLGLPSYHH